MRREEKGGRGKEGRWRGRIEGVKIKGGKERGKGKKEKKQGEKGKLK